MSFVITRLKRIFFRMFFPPVYKDCSLLESYLARPLMALGIWAEILRGRMNLQYKWRIIRKLCVGIIGAYC